MQLFKVETFSDFLSQCQNLSRTDHTVQANFSDWNCESSTEDCSVQYDLVESIKNTNTEACSDDLSSNRLSSFIFKAIKMHSSGVHFSFKLLFLFSHPMSMFVFAA